MPLIRPATAADHPVIGSIARRTWPDTFGSILSAAQITYMLDRMYSPVALADQTALGHRFLLLESNGVVVGYVSYEHHYLPRTTKIHKLYLLPTAQGNGYGRLLIQAVTECARSAGLTTLRLDVNYQNPAVDFYEYLGFAKIERVDTSIGNGYLMEDWVMERVIG